MYVAGRIGEAGAGSGILQSEEAGEEGRHLGACDQCVGTEPVVPRGIAALRHTPRRQRLDVVPMNGPVQIDELAGRRHLELGRPDDHRRHLGPRERPIRAVPIVGRRVAASCYADRGDGIDRPFMDRVFVVDEPVRGRGAGSRHRTEGRDDAQQGDEYRREERPLGSASGNGGGHCHGISGLGAGNCVRISAGRSLCLICLARARSVYGCVTETSNSAAPLIDHTAIW